MYELDKAQFGAFVAAARKEKGYTQKQLADLLHISNKAVSKWETGVTIPDVTLLVPLAEALGVTVTELLNCRRLQEDLPMDSHQTEELVKKVIVLSESEQRKFLPDRFRRGIQLLLYTAVGLLEIGLLLWMGYAPEELSVSLSTMMLLMFVFGLYFCVFARERLPQYYDDNKISAFSDGFFRMNIPGVYFNNRNWPYILRAGQLWAMIGLAASPALFFVVRRFFPVVWHTAWTFLILLLSLGGLFLPIFLVARKYEYAPDDPRPAQQTKRDWIWIGACFALLLLLSIVFPITGLTTTGSGSRIGWSEGNTLDSWNASYTYFQGYRQRVINMDGDAATLHIDAIAEEGTLGLLITDMDGQVLFEEEFPESVSLDVPIPGKVQVRVIGKAGKGGFSMAW